MPAVGNRNASGAATIAEPFASLGDCRPAGNLLADPNLHVVDQKRQPTGIASLLKRGGNWQPVDRLHRQLLHRQVATRQQNQYSGVSCNSSSRSSHIFKARTPTYFKLWRSAACWRDEERTLSRLRGLRSDLIEIC